MEELVEEIELFEEKEMHLIFKSFIRSQLHQLKRLEEALQDGEITKAEKIVKELIEDTQKGIED